MSAETRGFLEPRFGYDFGQVRIHASATAAEAARAVNARAFTVGHDIVFGTGNYAPDSAPGRRLLAHELTHVIQQHGPSRGLVQRQPVPADEFAPKPPLAQAREDINNALLTASWKLDQAIRNRDNDAALAKDVFDAYERFFRNSSVDKLDLLKTRVDDALEYREPCRVARRCGDHGHVSTLTCAHGEWHIEKRLVQRSGATRGLATLA